MIFVHNQLQNGKEGSIFLSLFLLSLLLLIFFYFEVINLALNESDLSLYAC
jgi:hypothetical protein